MFSLMKRFAVASAVAAGAILLMTLPVTTQSPACDPDSGGIKLPTGFCALVVASNIGPARHLTVAPNGDVYVADTNNHRIQKLSRDGQSLAMWGGEGDGPAQFRFPQSVALDSQGMIYVADSRNHRVQRLTPQGAYSAAWGSPGSAPGQFSSPQGLAVDQQGLLYVADTDNNRVQRINLGST